MIPWGQFRPDVAGINAQVVTTALNVMPGASGFLPAPSLQPVISALPSQCKGAVAVVTDDGSVDVFAATATNLYRLLPLTSTWADSSSSIVQPDPVLDDTGETVLADDGSIVYLTTVTTPGNFDPVLDDAGEGVLDDSGNLIFVSDESLPHYALPDGDQWRFAAFGPSMLAINDVDGLQAIALSGGNQFVTVSTAPAAKYIAVVRDFVLLGAVAGNQKRVQWCANNDYTSWTPAVRESDFQDFPDGGPVRGLIGGEVGWIFQETKVSRMSYAPGTATIFQFDEIEGGAGLAGPASLVRLRQTAYYLALDGFRKFDLRSGASEVIGVGKWQRWFLDDIKPSYEFSVIGAAHPVRPVIQWAYVSKTNSTIIPNRILVYDWSIDEASYIDVSVEAMLTWISPGVTLDSMDSIGNLDALPFSLDSLAWQGGAGAFAMFDTTHALNLQAGPAMQATIITGDGAQPSRTFISGTRPTVDASGVTVAVAMRERHADAIVFGHDESMEDTGVCPAHVSGNIARARVTIPAGQVWTQAQGLDTTVMKRGRR